MCLAGTILECGRNSLQLLRINRPRSATSSSTSSRSFQSCHDALAGQGTLVLCQCSKDAEQESALGRGCIHLFGQRPKPHLSSLKPCYYLQEMRQRSSKAVQLPHHQAIAGAHVVQGRSQAGAIRPSATRLVLEQMPLVNPRCEQRVADRSSVGPIRWIRACSPPACSNNPSELCLCTNYNGTWILVHTGRCLAICDFW